jgi:hypothetical protein
VGAEGMERRNQNVSKKDIMSTRFCQQMHSLLKHKVLQLTLKMSLCMAPTCFGLFGPLHSNNFNDVFLLIISTKTVTLARFRRMLPGDGPNRPKHAGAI